MEKTHYSSWYFRLLYPASLLKNSQQLFGSKGKIKSEKGLDLGYQELNVYFLILLKITTYFGLFIYFFWIETLPSYYRYLYLTPILFESCWSLSGVLRSWSLEPAGMSLNRWLLAVLQTKPHYPLWAAIWVSVWVANVCPFDSSPVH